MKSVRHPDLWNVHSLGREFGYEKVDVVGSELSEKIGFLEIGRLGGGRSGIIEYRHNH
jgi:hypothetical protein